MMGLLYHLENPVGALRTCRALCRKLCLIETQIVPGMSGWVDYGGYQYVRPLKGSFGIIDETGDTHGPEASITGICLVPSLEALLWILEKVGFSQVQRAGTAGRCLRATAASQAGHGCGAGVNRARVKFEVHNVCGLARTRPHRDAARADQDAGLHAGGHLRHGQGDGA